MKKKGFRRSVALTLAMAITASMAGQVSAMDTPLLTGDAAPGENQPSYHGYNPEGLRTWSEETDPYAKYGRSYTPLQERIDAFAATQADPELDPNTEYLALVGDYGNSFFETFQSNNFFSNYLYNFWQYTDYYASWHGQVTADCPPDVPGWQERKFEFGVVNLPNAAYTSAAHKNGALSLGCFYEPRPSQPVSALLVKDENGNFPVADKLKEIADYYGFDGYFFNQEDRVPLEQIPLYQEFLHYARNLGMYIQWYDSIDAFTGQVRCMNWFVDNNSAFIRTEEYGDMANSIFLNYGWNANSVEESSAHAVSLGLDPQKTVFFGIEAGKDRWNQPHPEDALYWDEGGTNASIAVLGSDFVHNGLGEDVTGLSENPHMNPDYQWMTFERERIWFSGPEKDPSKAGVNTGIDNTKVTGNTTNQWGGVANYISERSVVDGSVFYTNFNTGHGMQYFKDGAVSNDEEWTNMNVQDILPTWQWWMESEGTELSVNFDYGEKYNKGDYYNYQSVGAYDGGSSLVVNGKLDAENFLRLYKTDLQVKDSTKASITFNKVSATDSSTMELGVIFKNDPNTVVTFNIPRANQQTDGWVTREISLGDYAGEEIAAMGLVFKNGKDAIDNYQMNIGQIKISDNAGYTPEKPTGFTLEEAFDTNEMNVKWDLADYDQVKQYNLYAQLSDGTTRYVGGAYSDVYYIKSLYGEKDVVKLLLTAVGEDGSESEPAELSFDYKQNVSNVEYTANAGYIDFTWEAPVNDDYDSIVIEISLDATDKEDVFTAEVEKGATSARVMVPLNDGYRFDAAISTVKDGVKSQPIVQSGRTKDCYIKPYNGIVELASTGLYEFSAPTSTDWWHMYLYENGVQTRCITRGVDYINGVSAKGVVSVVLEDYSGNLSEPVIIDAVPSGGNVYQDRDITEQDIPDAALLAAVKAQAGDTVQSVLNFTSTLDLSNTEVCNLEGISLLRNMTGLDLSGCTKLTTILPDTFAQNGKLSSINLTGCTGLEIIGLNNSSLDTIICEDPSQLASAVAVDLSGSRFDLSEGTQEKAFADAMEEITEGKQDKVSEEEELSNLARGAAIVMDQTTVEEYVAEGIVDGSPNIVDLMAPNTIVFDLGASQTITSWKLSNFEFEGYGLKDFNIYGSNDAAEYTLIAQVTGNSSVEVSQEVENPTPYRYYKLKAVSSQDYGGYITELELYGHRQIVYPAGVKTDGQRPLVYPDLDQTLYFDKSLNGKEIEMNAYYENSKENAVSIRGTSLSDLKKAPFIADGYDWENAYGTKELHQVLITDADGNVTMDTIPANQDGRYTVQYITYDDENYQGKVMFTQTVYVRAVTTVLERIIANAEELLANGSLDNTMEAVVNEFNAALANAKEIVAKDGATQQEINDATERLLKVMAKVDWKQGDKTALQVAVDIANAIKPDLDLYVEAGKQEFLDALAKGEELLASGNAWDDEIKAATDELIEAMSNLRMAPNKDVLNEMIAQAGAIDLSVYTADSAAALTNALAEARAVAADENATQAEVDAAANTLQAAMSGLVFVNGGENNAEEGNTTETGNSGTTGIAIPAGEGTAPTKTGDAGVAGIASLAVLSAACALVILKKKQR